LNKGKLFKIMPSKGRMGKMGKKWISNIGKIFLCGPRLLKWVGCSLMNSILTYRSTLISWTM
jgi:hypothetical protein